MNPIPDHQPVKDGQHFWSHCEIRQPRHYPMKKAKLAVEEGVKYIVDGQLLRVSPYWFDYCTWAKGRWIGKTLQQVFLKEFRDRPPTYYRQACQNGLIRVNDSAVSFDYVIKQGDRVQHRIHRHEPPVLMDPPPRVVHVGDGFLAVEKPASVPMHPSGRYRHNSLTELLKNRIAPELFDDHVSCVNRLDRLVSGLVLMTTKPERADELRQAMQEGLFKKFYLARVEGDFRGVFEKRWLKSLDETDPLSVDIQSLEGISCKEDFKAWICDAPLNIVQHKLGMSCVADDSIYPSAKPSKTLFRVLNYSAKENKSLILAQPITGRTHQIRIHLQYCGHAIHNDPLYAGPQWSDLFKTDEAVGVEGWLEKVQSIAEQIRFTDSEDTYSSDETVSFKECPDCENPPNDPQQLSIDLHAFKYSGPIGTFQTALPIWAEEFNS